MAGGERVSIVHRGRGRCRKLHPFFGTWLPRAGFSYVLAECGLGLRMRIKRSEIGSKNPTFCGSSNVAGGCLTAATRPTPPGHRD